MAHREKSHRDTPSPLHRTHVSVINLFFLFSFPPHLVPPPPPESPTLFTRDANCASAAPDSSPSRSEPPPLAPCAPLFPSLQPSPSLQSCISSQRPSAQPAEGPPLQTPWRPPAVLRPAHLSLFSSLQPRILVAGTPPHFPESKRPGRARECRRPSPGLHLRRASTRYARLVPSPSCCAKPSTPNSNLIFWLENHVDRGE